MLPTHACYRAAQRVVRIHFPNDFVWNSGNAIISFATSWNSTICKTSKRHGSFVPGPLECHWRLGRRRMAYMSEPFTTPVQKWWLRWRYFREFDYAQWKWEPPRLMARNEASDSKTPRFILQTRLLEPSISGNSTMEDQCSREEIEALRNFIHDPHQVLTTKESFHNVDTKFCPLPTKNTTSESYLRQLFDEVIYLLQEKISDPELRNSLCFSFYKLTLASIINSRAHRHEALSGKLLCRLLLELSKFPSFSDAQGLATNVIQSASTVQLREMQEGITSMATSWALSWREDVDADAPAESAKKIDLAFEELLAAAEIISQRVDQTISTAQRLVSGERHSDERQNSIRIALREVSDGIYSSLETLEEAEILLEPARSSITSLAKALDYLPRYLLKSVLDACASKLFQKKFVKEPRDLQILGYGWLSMISQLSSVGKWKYVQYWKYIETHSGPLPTHLCVELILNKWASVGELPSRALVKNFMETTTLIWPEDFGSWMSLIFAIYKVDAHTQHFYKMWYLFGSLHIFGKFETVACIIPRMYQLRLKLPARIFEYVVETMTRYNPQKSLDLAMIQPGMKPGARYNQDYSKASWHTRGDYRSIVFSRCPDFVMWMVDNPKIHPLRIWGMLRIPIYSRMSRQHFDRLRSPVPLDPYMRDFINRLALAFAYSPRLSAKAASDNVAQCLSHLRRHGMRMDQNISRALIHAGLARYIESNRWIPIPKLAWLLRVVEEAEGSEFAEQVRQSVVIWNASLDAKVSRGYRESNVLRVGPID